MWVVGWLAGWSAWLAGSFVLLQLLGSLFAVCMFYLSAGWVLGAEARLRICRVLGSLSSVICLHLPSIPPARLNISI